MTSSTLSTDERELIWLQNNAKADSARERATAPLLGRNMRDAGPILPLEGPRDGRIRSCNAPKGSTLRLRRVNCHSKKLTQDNSGTRPRDDAQPGLLGRPKLKRASGALKLMSVEEQHAAGVHSIKLGPRPLFY